MSRVTLFCLPHAGGSATIYNKWQKYLDNSIALYRVELSGRGKRFNQNLYNSMEEAIEDIYYQIKPLLISPFSFLATVWEVYWRMNCVAKLNNRMD